MAEVTLKEIAEFRILSSYYKKVDLPESQVQTINGHLRNIPQKAYNNGLIEEIFRKLGFKHGGTIWVKANFSELSNGYEIKIGNHVLLPAKKYSKSKNRIRNKFTTFKLRSDTPKNCIKKKLPSH